MTMKQSESEVARLPKDPFAYIGFWQFMTFIMLILLVWVNEVQDMPALLFNTNPQDVNIFRGCLLTAGVLIAAIVAIGNTYLQEKRVLNTFISVCSSCNKVHVNQNQWMQMDAYISENSLLTFIHGLCPDCMKKIMQMSPGQQTDWKDHRSRSAGTGYGVSVQAGIPELSPSQSGRRGTINKGQASP